MTTAREATSTAYFGDASILSLEACRVLQLVADGLGAGAIARRLGCDRDDVYQCLVEAIRALSARSVPDAVEVAIRRGLIEEPTG